MLTPEVFKNGLADLALDRRTFNCMYKWADTEDFKRAMLDNNITKMEDLPNLPMAVVGRIRNLGNKSIDIYINSLVEIGWAEHVKGVDKLPIAVKTRAQEIYRELELVRHKTQLYLNDLDSFMGSFTGLVNKRNGDDV